MATILRNWLALGLARQLSIIVSLAVLLALLAMMVKVTTRTQMSLLYSGLDPAASGEVLNALDQMGEVYDIRGPAIYVASSARDTLRMQLAGQGLPAGGAQGYELLDSLTGFGTTAQMFDAAFWRAKEGELSRTIASSMAVRSARVHIASGRFSPLSKTAAERASVSVSTTGIRLPRDQIDAIRHLVASAVPGLTPESVSVIDARHGLLTGMDQDQTLMSDHREAALKASLTRLLEARVGPGNAIVEVRLDAITEREEISERVIDPDSRVAISQDTEERSNKASNGIASAVTVASNLPDGDAGSDGQNSESNDNETREITNFDVSETVRDIVREPGGIKRISVAVLVDGIEVSDDAGATSWQPRSDEELADLQLLVSAAAGLNEDRGDSVTIRTLEFAAPAEDFVDTAVAHWSDRLDVTQLLQAAILGLVTLVSAIFVVRPILASGRRSLGSDSVLLPGTETATSAVPEILEPLGQPPSASDSTLPAAKVPVPADQVTENHSPASRIRQLMSDRESETLKVLNDWMSDDGRARG